jgi:hypothetical protein
LRIRVARTCRRILRHGAFDGAHILRPSSRSEGPYMPDIPMQPRPMAETSGPVFAKR